MFGIFKQGPKYSKQYRCEQLGNASDDLIRAGSQSNDLDVAGFGSAAIVATIRAAEEHLGLKVRPGSAFSNYLSALEQQDISTVVEMVKHMSDRLTEADTPELRGELIHFWITRQP
jgi:hypothetical protein